MEDKDLIILQGGKGAKQKYAYNSIKQDIILNKYHPGEALVEKELCEKLGGLSRTPVRDALLKLSYEGLVENVPGYGMRVADLKFEDLFETLELRLPLEKTAIRLFIARAGDEEKKLLSKIYEEHKNSWERDDLKSAVTLDNQFHKFIGKGSMNSLLRGYIGSLIEQSGRSAYYTVGDKDRIAISLDEHKTILDAILAGDEEKAEKTMEDHLKSWSRYLVDIRMKRYYLLNQGK